MLPDFNQKVVCRAQYQENPAWVSLNELPINRQYVRLNPGHTNNTMFLNPVFSVVNYTLHAVSGRVRISRSGREIKLFHDKVFTAFRHLEFRKRETAEPTVFWVRFILPEETNFARNLRKDERYLPFLSGQPGLREKYWGLHAPSHEYLGLYEWSSRRRAERYSHSLALRFILRYADPDSVQQGILADKTLRGLISEEDFIVFNPFHKGA